MPQMEEPDHTYICRKELPVQSDPVAPADVWYCVWSLWEARTRRKNCVYHSIVWSQWQLEQLLTTVRTRQENGVMLGRVCVNYP